MVNAQGGVNGHKLQLVSYDDGLDANTAYTEAVRLNTQDKVFAIVGWLAPFGESKAAPYFEQQGVPIVGGLGVPEEFQSAYSIPVSPVFKTDGYLFGQYATKSSGPLHFHHPGVIVVNTAGIDDFVNGIIQAASDVEKVTFTENDYPTIMLHFKGDNVDGLITQLDPYSYVRMYQAEQGSGTYPHLAGAGIDKQAVTNAIGSQLVNTYSYMPYLEARGNPTGNGEVALYNNTVPHYYPDEAGKMDAFAEGAWESCRLFTQALSQLGASVTRDGLVHALQLLSGYNANGMSPTLSYMPTGQSCPYYNASRCATYIVYNSNHAWVSSVSSPYFQNCH
jgi:branched-chain amino acid transport system substrate-binding protein